MGHVYTARICIAHHELDAFGRAYPAACVRHLGAVAVDASAAAGFDDRWYATHGVHWLVRRTTLALHAALTAGMEVEVRTWVVDFRRVRSERRYEMRAGDGRLLLDAATDWVLVESATGKLRRIPEAIERAFGAAAEEGAPAPRAAFVAPPPPSRALRVGCAVRYTDLDALAHVNNATYLDLLLDAGLGALADVGWGLDRLVAAAAVPFCTAADVEYLDAAVLGDGLEVLSWFTPHEDVLAVHQRIDRRADGRTLVRATARWSWRDPATRAVARTPPELVRALDGAVAA